MILRMKWNLHDKFVIGVVARNQPRKFLDRTLKAMNLIKDKIPNAIMAPTTKRAILTTLELLPGVRISSLSEGFFTSSI